MLDIYQCDEPEYVRSFFELSNYEALEPYDVLGEPEYEALELYDVLDEPEYEALEPYDVLGEPEYAEDNVIKKDAASTMHNAAEQVGFDVGRNNDMEMSVIDPYYDKQYEAEEELKKEKLKNKGDSWTKQIFELILAIIGICFMGYIGTFLLSGAMIINSITIPLIIIGYIAYKVFKAFK